MKAGVHLNDLRFGNGLLYMTQKAQTREKIDLLYFMKIKKLCITGYYQENEETT